MALGTITRNNANHLGNSTHAYVGDLKVTNTTVVLDSSYPTGGSALTASQLGLASVVFAQTLPKVIGANGPVGGTYYDIPTSKLLSYSGTAQITNATDLSASTVNITAYGY